ncbi:Peptidase family S41 [compost metagenome]
MKKHLFPFIIALFFNQNAYSQEKQRPLNVDFEETEGNKPVGWNNFGSEAYQIYSDSVTVKSGKFSVVIESTGEESGFKALAWNLPDNYAGKVIRLKGFIKTENVTGGYAGLWMRIDPQLGFDNMNKRGVIGTTDWQEYEIMLPLNPKKTDQIVIGGLLVGKGKMWLDDFTVSIDGKDISDPGIEVFQKEVFLADQDKEFDGGSNIVFPDISAELVNNLELLGRVWGFLKYHHPEIAKGNYNWDYELFRVLPGYLNVKNNRERDELMTSWIQKYGKIPVCKTCKPTKGTAVLRPDLVWIDNSDLSEDLRKQLKEVYANRNQGKNYYLAFHPGVGNPDFTHENRYSDMPFPDAGFRLLAVYKYWNIIEYMFPNKHLTNKQWSTVLKEYIPKFLGAADELEYELVAQRLIGEVNDSHAKLQDGDDKIEELRGNNYAPFRVEFVENKLVVTDYYNTEYSEIAKLKVGDIITHIGGRTVQSIVDSLRPDYPASNDAAMLRDISADLLRSSPYTALKLNVNYISDGESKQHAVPLYDHKRLNRYRWYKTNEDERCFKLLEGNIGYVTLATIKEEDIPEIKALFKNAKGIIIDIRNYPSTFVPFSLGSFFLSKSTPFVKFSLGSVGNPGEFMVTKSLDIPGSKAAFKGKLVVLVNENSQSQAEYTAMAFRAAKNSTIIGSTTAGADGNVSSIFLPGGLVTVISGIGVYYPDGKETQRIGIVPDIHVERTIEGIKNGKDEVLEKAIQQINP